MVHFDTDYMAGALPEVIEALVKTNLEMTPGYGSDEYCAKAKDLIRNACGDPSLDVWFLVGGTQTNSTIIDAVLGHHEGVLSAETGHINVHESGAIEATGHKVLTLPSYQGKVSPKDVEDFIKNFYADDTYEHMVAPGMLYISFPSEYGTLYSKDELKELSRICHENGIKLFLDGARLGYGLAASDITLAEIAQLVDVFYIGGTKCGAMFGEAVVAKSGLLNHFLPLIKQHGALLAKGRLLGVQYQALFTDDLYFKATASAITLAMRLKEGFVKMGYKPFIDSPTNQQFFDLPNIVIDKLQSVATFEFWGPRGAESSRVRFVTSWATKSEDIDVLLGAL